MAETKLGGRTDEVRIGMSIYWVETRSEADGQRQGFRWSAIDGKVGGWTWGSRAAALREAREALLAREALHRVVVEQDAAAPSVEDEYRPEPEAAKDSPWPFWGTCVDCPTDPSGYRRQRPWECIWRNRYDHRIPATLGGPGPEPPRDERPWREVAAAPSSCPDWAVVAWVWDRREQYSPSSGTYEGLSQIIKGLAHGAHVEAWKHGELDDLKADAERVMRGR